MGQVTDLTRADVDVRLVSAGLDDIDTFGARTDRFATRRLVGAHTLDPPAASASGPGAGRSPSPCWPPFCDW